MQVWTVEKPHAITDDARKEPRSVPLLARRKEDLQTPYECWYNASVSHEMFTLMELYFNQHLDGKYAIEYSMCIVYCILSPLPHHLPHIARTPALHIQPPRS